VVGRLLKGIDIQIRGIVQGVGFRPFVYHLARRLGIKGWVNNSSDGVHIHAEAEEPALENFYRLLAEEKPPISVILSMERREAKLYYYRDFQITASEEAQNKDVLISPDLATCPDCLREMFDPEDRRYGYPFINCTNCGPRYTIIKSRPYDRVNTTMKAFAMCEACRREYSEPTDRRFHAQPVACADCGPRLELTDAEGKAVGGDQETAAGPLCESARLLRQGAILAVKGLGGFHLVCDAYLDSAVRRLRSLKERGAKPFALMAKNIKTAELEVEISETEERLLSSTAAPIVLLPRKGKKAKNAETKLAASVAPGLFTLGIMLPYTPIHHLLMAEGFDFLVMTSANLSGKPLIYENTVALKELRGIADYFLLHNRDIYHPCDDSVIQTIGGKPTFIRRARGYVPYPLATQHDFKEAVAALGGEMKNAFCLAAGKMAFMSQYIGDMHGYENLERFKQEFYSFRYTANVFPKAVAYDQHPEYSTTKIAREMDGPKIQVQHHHAHLVSVLGEYGINEPTLGIICDGTGYGEDGKIWGFEFLFGNAAGYERKGHLEYLPLPGGDAAAKKPLRIAYAYLKKCLPPEEWEQTENFWVRLSSRERNVLDGLLKNNIQLFETSSAGRLFDAVSALLDICTEVSYEGQAAIELESVAFCWKKQGLQSSDQAESERVRKIERKLKEEALALLGVAPEVRRDPADPGVFGTGDDSDSCSGLFNEEKLYPYRLAESNGEIILKADLFLRWLVRDILAGQDKGEIAYRFHYSLAAWMLATALILGYKGQRIVLGGGVFQNKLLSEILLALAGEAGLEILYPQKLPSGDGGLAFGQALIAGEALAAGRGLAGSE